MPSTKLYSQLARVYHEMYLSIFDYQEEFRFYDGLLKKHGGRSVLEIGCGSGNLAPYFLKENYTYLGLDLYHEMIAIAQTNHPRADFVQGDMRDLKLERTFDAVLITGRSIAYIVTNPDVIRTFESIRRVLNPGGVLIFDSFKAGHIIPNLKKEFSQEVTYGDTQYKRVNRTSLNLETGWTWNWRATYHIKEKDKPERIIEDESLLRAFTEDELRLFFKLTGYQVREIIDGDTFTFVVTPT